MIALAPPRHACHACGGCCRGAVVRLVDAEEAARVRAAGATLGIADPVVDGALRRVDGACVFLGADARCAIHAALGAEAKPAVCRQYPLVWMKDEAEARIGVDPGCYTASLTAGDGRLLTAEEAELAVRAPLPPPLVGMEAGVLRVTRGATVGVALLALLPPGAGTDAERLDALLARWHARLRASEARALLDAPEAGASLRDALAPVLDAVAHEAAAPRFPLLPPELDRAAMDAARAVVFLRLARLLPPHATMLATLLGAATSATALTTSDGEVDARRFAAALAGWSRALRAPPFVRAILPDEGALRGLVGA
jgi:Fe-S-cluster containining protein